MPRMYDGMVAQQEGLAALQLSSRLALGEMARQPPRSDQDVEHTSGTHLVLVPGLARLFEAWRIFEAALVEGTRREG